MRQERSKSAAKAGWEAILEPRKSWQEGTYLGLNLRDGVDTLGTGPGVVLCGELRGSFGPPAFSDISNNLIPNTVLEGIAFNSSLTLPDAVLANSKLWIRNNTIGSAGDTNYGIVFWSSTFSSVVIANNAYRRGICANGKNASLRQSES